MIQKNIDCEIVDIEKKNNLLSYLNFNFSDEKNEEIKRKYSQKAPKEFYSMFLEYILNRDVKTIKENFEKIYNKFDVIDIKSVYSIKENFEIINLINKEIEIYNKIGEQIMAIVPKGIVVHSMGEYLQWEGEWITAHEFLKALKLPFTLFE